MALLKYCELVYGNVDTVRLQHPKVAEIPFNSTNKYQAGREGHSEETGVHSWNSRRQLPAADEGRSREDPLPLQTHHVLFFHLSATRRWKGHDRPIDDWVKKKFQHVCPVSPEGLIQAYEKMGGWGERVLGFCDLQLDKEEFPKDFKFDTDKVNFPLKVRVSAMGSV